MTTARLAAARVLVAVERGRTTLAAELELARGAVDAARDRGLLLELAAGTLRWRAELDAIITAQSRRGVADLDPDVRAVLRLGAYQLRHLDRVPVHAVVHESVETARALGHARATGFVNAVLRGIVRAGSRVPLPPRPGAEATREDRLAYLAVTLSHPRWLAERWLDRHGFAETERWCRFNNEPPVVTARAIGRDPEAARVALHAAEAGATPGLFVKDAIRLPSGALARLSPELRDSLLVQDEASQVVAHVAGARPGERILDLCAAPGGKASFMAAVAGPAGLLVAADLRRGRAAILRATLQRAGVPARVVALDASRPLPFGPVFDRVLLDAPCSGLGTVRRDPDIKWARQPEDLPVLASAQRRMIRQAAGAVPPGGTLIYATCSSEPEENEEVVGGFLEEHPWFGRVRAEPGPGVERGSELVDAQGFLRTLPGRHGLEAFFAAVLVRRRSA